MNSKIIKKILIFLILLLAIIITIIIIIKKSNHNNKEEKELTGNDIIESYANNCNEGIDDQTYFDIKEHIQKYIDYININKEYYDKEQDYTITLEKEEISQKIYNLLSNKYIKEKNLTVENLFSHIKVLQQSAVFVPIEISLIQDGDIKSFLVQGLIQSENDYTLIDKMFLIINIDFTKFIFSIEPIEGEYTNIGEIKLGELEDTVIPNENNRFSMMNVLYENVAEEYVKLYKYFALGAPEILYDSLDEEYRNAKFGNIDEFKSYIQKNKAKIITSGLDKYNINTEGDNKKFICIDKNGDTYVINQYGAFNKYKMMLDIYTKDLPEFIEKYDKSKNHEKVSLNIKKLIQATKDGDYKYVYSKINETFRDTNFKAQQDFENFIKLKYSEGDTIKYKKYEEITGLHIYHVEVTKKDNKEKINAKIIMKLKDNRDFEISFSTEN